MQRLLIIEDDEAIAKLEKDYLEVNQFDVVIENNGKTGLKRALEEEFDLLILDIMLPDLDGFEVCKEVRDVKNTPILFVTAKKDDIDKIRGFGLGADDYITKPFSPGELVARVKAHLSRFERLIGSNAPDRKNVIEIRGLKLDEDSRIVTVNGEDVQLSSREFDLLMYMVKNPNKVISKEELFENIWGMDSYGEISTVTVHIKKVREKIELEPSKPQYIETIWGIGYRFRI
ncbi:MAG: response regulator transcription factor [Lachnospiraceae bacterium]|nr:response regulator transcription factor [Lachnospiraceae bacterium]